MSQLFKDEKICGCFKLKRENVRENGWETAKLCWENAIMRNFVREAEPSKNNIPLWTLDKNGEYPENRECAKMRGMQ